MASKPETNPGTPKREGSPSRAVLRPTGGPISYVPLKRKPRKAQPCQEAADQQPQANPAMDAEMEDTTP